MPMTAEKPAPKLERRRQRLLERIHRSYVTRTQTVRVGHLSLAFTRIADPDRVLDQVAAEADLQERLSGKRAADEHLHLPYWAELWDSAMGVGQFLARGCDGVTGRRGDGEKRSLLRPRVSPSPRLPVPASPLTVLDLGCGMGLSGTIAAALGAKVLFADIEPPALLFAQLNSLPWSSRVRTRRLNWQTDRLHERFDLIIGADILYERSQWEYQEPFLRHHLAPGGTVLMGEPGRQTGDLFVEWIRGLDWSFEMFTERVPSRDKPIRVLQLTKC